MSELPIAQFSIAPCRNFIQFWLFSRDQKIWTSTLQCKSMTISVFLDHATFTIIDILAPLVNFIGFEYRYRHAYKWLCCSTSLQQNPSSPGYHQLQIDGKQ